MTKYIFSWSRVMRQRVARCLFFTRNAKDVNTFRCGECDWQMLFERFTYPEV